VAGSPISSRVLCRHCNDVIGVYEPMVVLTDGEAQITSRTTAGDRPGERYHQACYVQVHGEEPGTSVEQR
jgi:hypothetical protein